MTRKPKPCIECSEAPKWNGKHRCWECWLRHQPITQQVQAAVLRHDAGPQPPLMRVPASEWPEGRRWCSGCQTMRSLRDIAPGASRCRPCNSAASHHRHIGRFYGVSAKEYADIAKLQNGRCAICRNRPVSKRLATDHDHRTGEFRGLLCKTCNHDLLGAAHESVRILQAAIDYLNHPPTSGGWHAPEERVLDHTVDTMPAPF